MPAPTTAWVICWEQQDLEHGQVTLHHRIAETRDAYLACLGECFDKGVEILGVSPHSEVMQAVTHAWALMMKAWHHMIVPDSDPGSVLSIELLPKDEKEFALRTTLAPPHVDCKTALREAMSRPGGQDLYRKLVESIDTLNAENTLNAGEIAKVAQMEAVALEIWRDKSIRPLDKIRAVQEKLGIMLDFSDLNGMLLRAFQQTSEDWGMQLKNIQTETTEDFSDVSPKLDKAIGSLDKILEAVPCTV